MIQVDFILNDVHSVVFSAALYQWTERKGAMRVVSRVT